jgi:hypothetical protein
MNNQCDLKCGFFLTLKNIIIDMHVMWYNEVNGIEQIYIKRIKKAPTWAKHLERSGHDSHMPRHMILANLAMCLGMLLPDLVWRMRTELLSGSP